jgi:hypothetical protein
MITSESTNKEFQRFFDEHREELSLRLAGLLKNKYRRAIISLLKKGAEIPPIWGMLKLPEATLYQLPIGIKPAKINFDVTSIASFMVMKDLRKQTPVLITDSEPRVIMYSAHAMARYKERMGMDPETDYLDVCKQMFLNGCSRPKLLADMSKIYGTDINHRQMYFITVNGVYMGYVDKKTEVLYADSFLSTEDLGDDQLYLNASKSEDLALWKEMKEAYAKGEINLKELKNYTQYTAYTDIGISDGQIVKLSPEELRIQNEENKKAITDPELIEKQKEENRQRYKNKIQRKGYK